MLATIGVVDCTFGHLPVAVPRPVPFSFFVHGMAVSLGMEQNGNVTIFWLLEYMSSSTHSLKLKIIFVGKKKRAKQTI